MKYIIIITGELASGKTSYGKKKTSLKSKEFKIDDNEIIVDTTDFSKVNPKREYLREFIEILI